MQEVPIRVALVEDSVSVAANLATVFENTDEFDLVGSFDSVEKTLNKIASLKPDLLVLDVGLPDMNGIDAIAAFRKLLPELKIVIFTVYEDGDLIVRAIQRGANGYLLKDIEPKLFLAELKVIMLGGAPLTPKVAQKISSLLSEETRTNNAAERPPLTERQVEILNHIALGFGYNEIADELDISPHTVKRHIENIYRVLEVNTKSEAIRSGFKFGFLRRLLE